MCWHLGETITQQGNVLVVADGKRLFVAESCSGLTPVVALTSIEVLLALVSPLSRGRQFVLVALVEPIAIGANLARFVTTVLATRLERRSRPR